MNEKQTNEWINQILREEQTLPEGMAHRLEHQIDTWDKAEKKGPMTDLLRKFCYGGSSIAAALLLALGIWQYVNNSRISNELLTDTYSSPQEAETVARKALLLISSNLNKGMKQASQTQKEISRISRFINKHCKE